MRGPALAASNNGTERPGTARRSITLVSLRPAPSSPSPLLRPGLTFSLRGELLSSAAPVWWRRQPREPRELCARHLRSRQPGAPQPSGSAGAGGPFVGEGVEECFCSELVTVAGWRLLPHYAPGLLVCGQADGGEVGSGGRLRPDLNPAHLSPSSRRSEQGAEKALLLAGEGGRGAALLGVCGCSSYLS